MLQQTHIILLGYGAMGREIEQLSPEYGCKVVQTFDVDSPLTQSSKADFDVAIDFTEPNAVLQNVKTVCALKKDMVIGTTGWYGKKNEIESMQSAASNGIIWGSNFSVGVQMFFRLVRAAGMLVNDAVDYDVMLHEWHHKRKKDSPSGTALTAASILLDEIERKSVVSTETKHETIKPEEVHVTSTRGGEVIGKHMLTIDATADSIDIIHTAKNRSGFAVGALLAAKWIHGKNGVFDFTDVFSHIIAVK